MAKWQPKLCGLLSEYMLRFFQLTLLPKIFLDPPLLASLSLHGGNLIVVNLFDAKTQL